MVQTHQPCATDREGNRAARAPWRTRRPHYPSQSRTGGQRLFSSAFANPGDQEHAPDDPDQDRLVIARDQGNSWNYSDVGRPGTVPGLTLATAAPTVPQLGSSMGGWLCLLLLRFYLRQLARSLTSPRHRRRLQPFPRRPSRQRKRKSARPIPNPILVRTWSSASVTRRPSGTSRASSAAPARVSASRATRWMG